MLESKYINGEEAPIYDNKISELIEDCDGPGGGKTMRIGIRNESGKIYRVIASTGLGSFMSITSSLGKIGLVDELYDIETTKDGFDCIFFASDELIQQSACERLDSKATIMNELDAAKASLDGLPETERASLVQSRLGQGSFRSNLVEYWNGCAVTDCSFIPLLKASHIKPWAVSDNLERLDHFNGLLLSPNLDAAFDVGLISFDGNGKIIISRSLNASDAYSLRITQKLKIRPKMLNEKHQRYLEYHRLNVFR
ncbi:HNH endonuclease [Parahaliea mediterranea]|uniref:HNH endonuclease n=1 Tax=Parahaliea mediterranea TaxID=651086 RepID=UPI000E2E4C5D|nr:HNH endonuclease [Parahaliea mediterranea]